MSANASPKGTHAVNPKGKTPKRFLGRDDALSLASFIADLQEKKSLIRSGKHQMSQTLGDSSKDDANRKSGSKDKLKETKALLREKTAKAKRERAKSRKERFKGSKETSDKASSLATSASTAFLAAYSEMAPGDLMSAKTQFDIRVIQDVSGRLLDLVESKLYQNTGSPIDIMGFESD